MVIRQLPALDGRRRIGFEGPARGAILALPAVCLAIAWLAVCAPTSAADVGKYFKIEVVDDQTGRGVPLVELTTVNAIRYYTDSNGIVAFHEPGLMDRTVFFYLKSHGCEFPADGFGLRGTKIKVTEGGSVRLKIKRINVAERLYRVTGGGIYRDSLLTGQPVPVRRPVLNGLVFGQDSVLSTIYHGKIYWFWGDTSWPEYPLGNFHCPGATSVLPGNGGLDPEVGVDLEYFVDDRGFARPTAELPGEGPTWLDGLITLTDDSARERLFARYVKIAKPMRMYEQGLVEFNDEKKQFEKCRQFDLDVPLVPLGHPLKHVSDGIEHIYFPLLTRVRARVGDLQDLSKYETYTCFKRGSRADSVELDRDAEGRLQYAWKTDTVPLTPELQQKLIGDGRMKRRESPLRVTDVETGRPVTIHRTSVYWNDYRNRWVMIMTEAFGTSYIGEIWYVEADTPIGPWVYARKILTHDKYSFYNPKQHPMFDQHGGRVIFFEGTYTHTFSGNPEQTPRYDYNQIMYKLDLADPRLVLPVAVYQVSDADAPSRFAVGSRRAGTGGKPPIAFRALDRWKAGTVAVFTVAISQEQADGDGTVLRASAAKESSADGAAEPLFYGLPADTEPAPAGTVPLYEFVSADGVRRAYSTDASWSKPGYRRTERPVCLVWRP